MIKNLICLNMYGFMIGGAMVLCIALAYVLLKKRGYNSERVFEVAIICIPLAIVGARFYYILFDVLGDKHTLSYWLSDLRFLGFERVGGKLEYQGLAGLAIFGGLIFATLGTIFVLKWTNGLPAKDKMSFYQMVDFFYIFIILGQAIGRWGNYFNQEAYGNIILNPNYQWFPLAVFIDAKEAYYQATFFYEFFFNSIGFLVLAYLYFGKKRSYDGFNFAVYCIWYGTVRTIVEGMRSDSLMIGSIRVSQWLAAILAIYGIISIVSHTKEAKRAGKKPFILIDNDKLSLDYFGYEKTIMYLNKLDEQEKNAKNNVQEM